VHTRLATRARPAHLPPPQLEKEMKAEQIKDKDSIGNIIRASSVGALGRGLSKSVLQRFNSGSGSTG